MAHNTQHTAQLSLPLSQIISPDAPLLSPLDSTMPDQPWDLPPDPNFSFYHMPSPAPSAPSTSSPVQTNRILKSRMSPDDQPDACVSTHQLFDITTPPSPAPSVERPTSRDPSLPPKLQAIQTHKRSASPSAAPAKKPRAQGERISSKDFVPPDVTGLSKREARLVKNRAAAFLSRQRKREEFETMEHRVAELESENARLLALTQNAGPVSDNKLASEIEQLKAQLAAAQDRERELSAKLANNPPTSSPQGAPVKLEAPDSHFALSSPARSSNMPSPNKAGASLGLMVLLCALPTLLSMPMHSSAPTSFTIPTPLLPPTSSSSFDLNAYLPNDYDWSRPSASSSIMDLDTTDDHQNRLHHRRLSASASSAIPPSIHTLEFSSDMTSEGVGALGNLDISFDATPAEDGKIRVRIHPASSASSRATSPGASSTSSSQYQWEDSIRSDGQLAAAPSPSSLSVSSIASSSSLSTSAFSPVDPFFGISDLGMSSSLGLDGSLSSMLYGEDAGMDLGMGMGIGGNGVFGIDKMSDVHFGMGGGIPMTDPQEQAQAKKRRVRIALKSMPQAGGAEGGEWEVQIC